MNQELLDQFFGLLEASSSFKLLSPEQQATIKESYQNVTDEQLNQAIQALKEDQVATEQLAAENQKNQENLEKEVVQMKGVIREVHRDERKKEEAADEVADKKEEVALLNEIETMEGPNKVEAPVKKRKKFLGIF